MKQRMCSPLDMNSSRVLEVSPRSRHSEREKLFDSDGDILMKWRVRRRLEEARQAVKGVTCVILPQRQQHGKGIYVCGTVT